MLIKLITLSSQYLKINSKKGDLNRIVTWVILLLVLVIMMYFIWTYLVGKGFGGFDPIINDTTKNSEAMEKDLFG